MAENWIKKGFSYTHPRLLMNWHPPVLTLTDDGSIVEDTPPNGGQFVSVFTADEVFLYFMEKFPHTLGFERREVGGAVFLYRMTTQFLHNYAGLQYERGEVDPLEIILYAIDIAAKAEQTAGVEIEKILDIDETYLKPALIAVNNKRSDMAYTEALWRKE